MSEEKTLPKTIIHHFPTNEAVEFAQELASYSGRSARAPVEAFTEEQENSDGPITGDDEAIEEKDPENDYVAYRVNDLNLESKGLVEDFEVLLQEVRFVDNKVVSLWRQIYKNAVQDRMNALLAWSDLYVKVHGNPDMHALHGDRLAKYAIASEKANAQLIKLSEMIALTKINEDNDEEDALTGKNIYSRIEAEKKRKGK